MKAAVFGAGGLVGRHLAEHLQGEGWTVRPILRGDETWRGEALGHVFYCIGLTADFRSRPYETVEAHVSRAVEVLRGAVFDSFLYCSSTRVYAKSTEACETAALSVNSNDPDDLYNLSKLMGEAACLAHPAARVARLSNVIGSDPTSDNFLNAVVREAVATGAVHLRTALDSAKDYIAVDEAVAAMRRIAVDGGERIYNLAAGRNTSHGQIVEALRRETGCAVSVAQDAPTVGFPLIDIERLTALGVRMDRDPVRSMPALVAAMRNAIART